MYLFVWLQFYLQTEVPCAPIEAVCFMNSNTVKKLWFALETFTNEVWVEQSYSDCGIFNAF